MIGFNDWPEKLREWLATPWKNRAGIGALLDTIADSIQSVDDEIVGMNHGLIFSQAEGEYLDYWGELVNQPREGLTDHWYRRLVRTAFLARRSDGTRESVIAIWQAATEDSVVEYRYASPNGIVLTAWRSDYLPDGYARRAAEIVRAAAPTAAVDLIECRAPAFGCVRTRLPYHRYCNSGIPARVH